MRSLVLPLCLIAALGLAPESAQAEGFPGIGDRLQYADSLPHYNLGNRYLSKEWYEKAVEKYHDAIKIYPYDADVYTNLGLALRKMNDVPGAEQAYREALKLNDKDWMTWSNLANMLMIQDRFPESLKCFDSALKCKLPPEEKDAIEKNIFGIKKIMKNLAIMNGASAAPVPVEKTQKGRALATAKGGKGKKLAEKPAASEEQSMHFAGDGKSTVDNGSYDSWLGQ